MPSVFICIHKQHYSLVNINNVDGTFYSNSFRKNQLKNSYEATDGKLEDSDEAMFTSAS